MFKKGPTHSACINDPLNAQHNVLGYLPRPAAVPKRKSGTCPASPAVLQPPAAEFSMVPVREQGREIRQRLAKEHIAGGFMYLEAGQLIKRNGPDVFHRFRADSNFVYATGCHDQPGAAALLDSETGSLTLMVEKQPDHAAFWMGPQPGPDELAEMYGADRVCYTSDLAAVLREQARGQDVHVASTAARETLEAALGTSSPSTQTAKDGEKEEGQADQRLGRITDSFLPKVLQRCRSHKTDAELACLLAASQVSGQGHLAAWRAAKANPGMHEFFLEGAFTGAVLAAGANDLGYPCIVGAGPNAAILHYETNRSRVRPQDLVLIDAGAEMRCYTADITRTFPASGKFTASQLDVYNSVLAVQELAISRMHLGAVWTEVDTTARMLCMQQLLELGLVKGSVEALLAKRIDRVFMPHGLGHFLGLDVHDMSAEGMVPTQGAPLEQGNVITVEPGLYFIDTLLIKASKDPEMAQMLHWDNIEMFRKEVGGVRIEDNVAVGIKGGRSGPEGLLNLTMAAGVPKAAHAIEEIMQQC